MQSLEQRLAVVEMELARLKELVAGTANQPWWQQWAGAFLNDPYFEKAMNYGRRYRESLRPGNKGGKRRKRKNVRP